MKQKTKRRRINVRSIEERMSDKLMQLHSCNPRTAWNMIKLNRMECELQAIG